jgi:hypothetical protein
VKLLPGERIEAVQDLDLVGVDGGGDGRDRARRLDLDAASARLQPLLDAQERFDSRVHAEPIAPANLPEGFAEAIDQLR